MAGHSEAAVARHGRVQRTVRRGAAGDGARDVDEPAPDLDELTRVRRHLGHRRAHGPKLLGRTGDPFADGTQHELTVARLTRRDPDVLTELRRLRGAIGNDVADLERRHPVHQRLVRFGVDGDAIAGQALDQIHLPQRPRLVQWPRAEPGDELVQLRVAARRRQRRPPDVVGDVEVAVVDPDRAGQPQRHLAHLLAVARDLRQPLFDGGQQGFIAQPGARPTQGRQRADVHRG